VHLQEALTARGMAPELRLMGQAKAAGRDERILYTPPAAKGAGPGAAHEQKPQPGPVRSVKRAWDTAQRDAGLSHSYRLHDIRAAYITSISLVAPNVVTHKLAPHCDM